MAGWQKNNCNNAGTLCKNKEDFIPKNIKKMKPSCEKISNLEHIFKMLFFFFTVFNDHIFLAI